MGSEPKRYAIAFKPAAQQALSRLSERNRRLIVGKIDDLALTPRPRGVEKLEGPDGLYRIRSGDYRVIYQIEDERLVVLVVTIGHRGDVYRVLKR